MAPRSPNEANRRFEYVTGIDVNEPRGRTTRDELVRYDRHSLPPLQVETLAIIEMDKDGTIIYRKPREDEHSED